MEEKAGGKESRPRLNSVSKTVASALNKSTQKLAKRRKLQVLYTILLCVAIGIIWVSLVGPISVAILSRPALANITRQHVTILQNALANNTAFSLSNCTLNDTIKSSINCSYDYVFNCTMCVPICGVWHPFGESYFIGYRVVASSIAVVDLIFSITGLIILLKVPGTFKFPQINYLFMFINSVIFSASLTVAALPGPYNFFCSQRKEDYAVVTEDPAIYITLLGVVTHSTYFSFNLWFLCATVNVFLLVYFPSWQILKSRKHKIAIFVIEAIVSSVIPLLFPIIYLAIFRKYSFLRLPLVPYIMKPIPGLIFIVLPLLLFTAISLTIISLTLYKLQIQKSVVHGGQQKIQLKSYEIRLIILSISLGIVVFLVFIGVTFDVYYSKILQFYLEEFWSCLTLKNNFNLFHVSNLTCTTEYKAYFQPNLHFVTGICVGAWSILLLIILTTKETRDAWYTVFKKVCRNPISSLVNRSRRFGSGINSTSKSNTVVKVNETTGGEGVKNL